jgi:hypothetical protein
MLRKKLESETANQTRVVVKGLLRVVIAVCWAINVLSKWLMTISIKR